MKGGMNTLKVCHAVISVFCLLLCSKGNDHIFPNLWNDPSFHLGSYLRARKNVAEPGTPGTFYMAQKDHSRQT